MLLVFAGAVEGGRLEAGDDASDAGFFPLTRLPAPLAYGPHRTVLRALLEARGLPVDATLFGPGNRTRGRSA